MTTDKSQTTVVIAEKDGEQLRIELSGTITGSLQVGQSLKWPGADNGWTVKEIRHVN